MRCISLQPHPGFHTLQRIAKKVGLTGRGQLLQRGSAGVVQFDGLAEESMAYDVHIVHTKHWLDAANDPITKEQVDALIVSDPELKWSTEDWVDMRAGRGKKVTRYYMILWKGDPCFWWYRDQTTCSGASEEQVGKMVEMATKLEANVFGDDGEAYCPHTWRAV